MWRRIGAAVLGGFVLATGCIDPSRVNRECRWTDTSSGRLQLDRDADREHLRQDAQVAWEVGQRYADVRYRNQPVLARPLLDTCRGAMWDSIAARHGVSRADIAEATRARVWSIDAATVFVPMLVLAVLATLLIEREAVRATTSDRALLGVRATVVIVTALIMTGLTQVWGMSVESWRLRNEHIAGRGSVVPSVAHPGIALLVAAVVAASVVWHRASRARLPRSTIS